MLTEAERSIVHRTFAQGPAILFEEGFDEKAASDFLRRPDVQSEMLLLERELDHQESLAARSRYVARRQLARLTPGAVAVIGQALLGPRYLMRPDESGNQVIATDVDGKPITLRKEPTAQQLRASEMVLEALGVPHQRARNGEAQTTPNIEILFRSTKETTAAKIDVDDPALSKEAQRALSRERVRNVIEILAERVPALHQRAIESLDSSVPTVKKKVVRKVRKKQAVRKKAPVKKKRRAQEG